MNPLNRYDAIMKRLFDEKSVSVQELSKELRVTSKTIREDLAKLEEKGLLVRVHGGAVLAENDLVSMMVSSGTSAQSVEKMDIAELAVSFIEDDDIVALDGGTTTLEIARWMPNRPTTVITNDLFIIGELAKKDQIRLVVPGGYRVRNMLTGPGVAEAVREFNIRKAFIAATGVHPDYGLSVYTGDFIDFKRVLVETADVVFCVAEHSKFDRYALRTFAALSEIDAILTDRGLTETAGKPYRDAGIRVMAASGKRSPKP